MMTKRHSREPLNKIIKKINELMKLNELRKINATKWAVPYRTCGARGARCRRRRRARGAGGRGARAPRTTRARARSPPRRCRRPPPCPPTGTIVYNVITSRKISLFGPMAITEHLNNNAYA